CYLNSADGCGVPDNIAPVGSVPAGNGKWGQADLAGNIEEWTRDSYGVYPVPCSNCSAAPSPSVNSVLRGGSFFTDVTTTIASVRDTADPNGAYVTYGARCARTP
ncbi:MAG TPA: SUMF1/EgtB/PvdO family nonheme iron enzyme, partial [Polyangiaceae bacterium]